MHRWFTIFSLAVSLVMMDLSRKTAEMDRRVFCDFHVNYYAHAMYDHIISSYASLDVRHHGHVYIIAA